MKNLERIPIFKICLLLVSLLMLQPEEAQASHFRYGNITWERVAGNPLQIRFRVTQSWRRNAFSNQNVGQTNTTGTLVTGAGNVPITLTITSINASENWMYGEFTHIQTYPSNGTYTAYFESCCRIGSPLQNNSNGWFRVSSIVQVGNGNDAPVSTVPPFISMPVNSSSATYQIPATDPNNDALTYSLVPNGQFGSGTTQPSGISVSSSGLLTFNTVGKTVGQFYNTAVYVTDANGARVQLDLMLRIATPSTPPAYDYTVTPANGTTYVLQPGQSLNFNVKASDVDAGDNVSLNAVGLPSGASFSPASGNPVTQSFSWTPTISGVGTYQVNFVAQDNAGIQTNTIVNIAVSLKPNFVSPSPVSGSILCYLPGSTITQTYTAEDADTADRVILSLATPSQSGMSFSPSLPTSAANPVSTNFTWNTSSSNWGINTVVVRATDTYSETRDDSVFYIINTPPVFTTTQGNTTVVPGQLFSYTFITNDADIPQGDAVDIEHIHIPSWLTLTNNNNGSWTISGTPAISDSGHYHVDIEIEDLTNHFGGTHCGNAGQSFEIEVPACVPADITTCSSNLTLNNTANNCSAPASYTVSTSGTPAPAVTYSFIGATTGSGTGTGSGSTFNVGTTNVQVVATNACGTDTCNFTVTVNDNQNPTITCPTDVTVNADNGACAATNVALGTPTTGDNCGVASTSNNGPSSYPVGTTTVTWTVTDVNGNTATCTQNVTVVDNQAPNASCKAYTLNLSGGTGTVNPSDVDNGSSDNCGIANMSVSPNTFTCADAGDNTVTLTVTDVNGNSSTCNAVVTVQYQPTCSITTTPSNNTYTGGNPNNIYLGYGPQSATITANATGGSGFTYSWSPAANLSCTNCQSPVFTPTAAGNYTYTLTVTNSNGCSTTCTVSFCVSDIRVPGKKGKSSGKVYLCHVPPGNPSNAKTLSVSVNAIASHLSNHSGDRLGSCDDACSAPRARKGRNNSEQETESTTAIAEHYTEMKIYPNPNNGTFTIELPTQNVAIITISNISGQVVYNENVEGTNKVSVNMSSMTPGIYMVKMTSGDVTKHTKLFIQ